MNQILPSDIAPQAPSGARVLVAEDMEMNRQLVQILLSYRGYVVDEAENGLEVLAAIEHCQYDLILMDCVMPEMDGYEACRRLREYEAAVGAPRTPVIAFTSNTQEQDRAMCRTVGMDDYLIKPFTADELINAVERWMQAPGSADRNKA